MLSWRQQLEIEISEVTKVDVNFPSGIKKVPNELILFSLPIIYSVVLFTFIHTNKCITLCFVAALVCFSYTFVMHFNWALSYANGPFIRFTPLRTFILRTLFHRLHFSTSIFPGGKHSAECTLILTEGDSAKSLAVSGLGVIGRDRYGVFPLRGKILNVREATHKQVQQEGLFEIWSL